MSQRYESVLELVGATPVVAVRRARDPRGAALWAKLEMRNPGGSIKDRIAVAMLEDAERAGRITPGKTTIVEATSGNTGIGLALVCAVKGYRLLLTMPDDLSMERRQLLRAYGAECVLTPAAEAMTGAVRRVVTLMDSIEDVFCPRQFANPANPEAHAVGTAAELIEQFSDIGLDGFVCGVGTGGTITGVSRVLREAFPGIRIWAVEPSRSAVLSGGTAGAHGIQGLGAGFVPDLLDLKAFDRVVAIPDEQAVEGARALAKAEGILAGISSGATFVAARRLARELGTEAHVAFICASGGERYLSTGLFR